MDQAAIQAGIRGSMFKPSRKFKRDYKRLHRKDPISANMFLLLAELANKEGRVATNEKELADLMSARFEDPRRYSL